MALDSPAAKVVAGSIASFTFKLSGQQLEDVQNSTLLAQLAADREFPDEKDIKDWYTFYRRVLGQVGWMCKISASKNTSLISLVSSYPR